MRQKFKKMFHRYYYLHVAATVQDEILIQSKISYCLNIMLENPSKPLQKLVLK
jgi:hypothetical protein